MSGRVLNLREALERFDVPYIEIDGWRERGVATLNPKGSVDHHTAGPLRGTTPSLDICINGRKGLPGPLCNVYGGRDLVARIVASGRANHAGLGGWMGMSGNSSVLGLEMEHTGTDAEPVTDACVEFMARIHAAFAWAAGFDSRYVCMHWEWAPNRKIDFRKGVVDPARFRGRVAALLDLAAKPPTPTDPSDDEEKELMAAKDEILRAVERTLPFAGRAARDGAGMKRGEVWIISPAGKFYVNRATLNALYFTGAIRQDANLQPAPINPADFADVPVIAG